MGVTPTPVVPSVRGHTATSGERMPMAWAVSTTFWGPTTLMSCANTAFTDAAVAAVNV